MDVPKLNSTTLWHIGLTYTTQLHKQFNNLQPTVWMNNTQTELSIPLLVDEGWVIFNLQSTGEILFNIYCIYFADHFYKIDK